MAGVPARVVGLALRRAESVNPIEEAPMYELSSAIREQAAWRDAKAEEYPDDERNKHSAEALLELASYVTQLREDDPRLRYLSEFNLSASDGVVLWGESATRELSRWGFGYGKVPGATEADRFVSRLCVLSALDTYESIRETETINEKEVIEGASFDRLAAVDELADEQGLLAVDVEAALRDESAWEASFARYGDSDWLRENILEGKGS
jgi:hypothetical protein